MMQREILLMSGFPALLEGLSGAYVVHRTYKVPDHRAMIADLGPRIAGLVTDPTCPPVDADLLDSMPNLQVIGVFGVGYDHVDVAAAHARGITAFNTRGANAADVAELAIGLLLAAGRRIAYADRYVREGRWLQRRMPNLPRMSGRKLGLFGMGAIGQAIARRAAAFDMPIAYAARTPRPELPYRFVPDLLSLAQESDLLIAAVPGGPATLHMIDRRVMDALGPEGILVNVGRGSTVDEAALADALEAGTLGAAALDVFEDEPKVPARLMALDNIVLQPHHGGATPESLNDGAAHVMRNLAAHFAGQAVSTPI